MTDPDEQPRILKNRQSFMKLWENYIAAKAKIEQLAQENAALKARIAELEARQDSP